MEEAISLEENKQSENASIDIKIADLSPLVCSKQRLIESSDYFEALISRGNYKEGVVGCVDFSLSQWKEEYYTFFSWLSSGTDLLKVINTRCLVFFIILGNYFQLKSSVLQTLEKYAGTIKILDPSVQSYLSSYWSYRYIPFDTMTNMILGNQSPQNNFSLLKLTLAWLDEDSFEDRRALESSIEFHQVRAFFKTISSWLPNNAADLFGIVERYPKAAQVIEVTSLLANMKAVCFCTRNTPQIVIKYQ